jgi:hypothetical protein
VREGEDKILTKEIVEIEEQGSMVIFAVDGIFGEIFESIVHPTHVPLQAES